VGSETIGVSTPPRLALRPSQASAPLVDPAARIEDISVTKRRRFALFFGLILVFLRVSLLNQIAAQLLGFNNYLLYIFGPPAILGLLLTGGIGRTFKMRTSLYWMAFLGWMIIDVPFSSWRGGSLAFLIQYIRTDVPLLFILAGLAVTWQECRRFLYAITLGAVMIVAAGRLFVVMDYGGERLSLAFGSISNSNDYAAHLLFAIPFLLFVITSPKVHTALRVLAGLFAAYGVYLILATASRGAAVALAVSGVYLLWRGTLRLRVALLVGVPVLATVVTIALPDAVLSRLSTLTTSSEDADNVEAAESARLRRSLLETGIRYTLENPIFGVGPEQFSSFEGKNEHTLGGHGYWRSPHSILTQVSSECGLPALAFYLCAIGSTFVLLHNLQRSARKTGNTELWSASLWVSTSLVGFLSAAVFLNLAYSFYLPALSGLTISMYLAARSTFQDSTPKLPWMPNFSFRPAAVPGAAAPGSIARVPPASQTGGSNKYRFGRLR
jgi:O-antigen ligase